MKTLLLCALASACLYGQSFTIGRAIYSGSGLNDATSGGSFTGRTANAQYAVTITTTGTPDKFKWSKNGGSLSAEISITGSAQTISDGVTVTFASTTGHTLGDSWLIRASAHGATNALTVVQSGAGAVLNQNAEAKLNDRVSCAIDFGAVGDGTTSAYTALNNCLNSGHPNLYIGPDKNGGATFSLGSNTLTPPNSVKRIDYANGVTITCETQCWDITGHTDFEYRLPAVDREGGAEWHAGTPDLASIGYRASYNTNGKIEFGGARYFHRGVLLCGGSSTPGDPCYTSAGTGQYHVEYRVGRVHDNKIGVDVQGDVGGFNQVQLYGGEIRINGSHCQLATVGGYNANRPYPDTRYLRIQSGSDGSNNMQLYIGTELQAGGECVERALEDAAGQIYIGPRFETLDYMETGSVETKGASIYNPYIGSGVADMFLRTISRTVSVDGTGLLVTRTAGQSFVGDDVATNFSIGVTIGGITYGVSSVTDGDHLVLSGYPFAVLAAQRGAGQTMITPLDTRGATGVITEGTMLFGGLTGWVQDFQFPTSRPLINLSRTTFPASQIDLDGDGVSVTWRSGEDFSLLPIGLTVRIEGDPLDNTIESKADATHFTLSRVATGAAVGATDYSLYVPSQLMTLSNLGALYVRSLYTTGTIVAASFNGVQIASSYTWCIGSVAGCARIELSGATAVPFVLYNASNSVTGLYGTMFESSSAAMVFGDVTGKDRLGAVGPTAARRFQFTCSDNGISSCGVELGYLRANSTATFVDISVSSGATFSGGTVAFAGATVTGLPSLTVSAGTGLSGGGGVSLGGSVSLSFAGLSGGATCSGGNPHVTAVTVSASTVTVTCGP